MSERRYNRGDGNLSALVRLAARSHAFSKKAWLLEAMVRLAKHVPLMRAKRAKEGMLSQEFHVF